MRNVLNRFSPRVKYSALIACAMLMMFAVGVPAQQNSVCLEVSGEFQAVNTAHSLTTGDFNRDGYMDVAVVAHRPKTPSEGVIVMLGDGMGGLSVVAKLPVGDHNHGIITADFNNDGHLDLVANTDSATAPTVPTNVEHVYFGDGTGQFPQHDMYKIDVKAGPLDSQAADVNNDGYPDLILAGAGPNPAGVMLNDGTGKLGAPTYFGSGFFTTRSATVADFNNDGNLDIVVTNEFGVTITLLLGDGTGSFTPVRKKFRADKGPRTVVAGDLDADGNIDLALTNRLSSTVSILFGDGAGSFSKPTNIKVGLDPRTIQIGDFNNDGILDIAAVNSLSQTVSFLFGDGDRGFSAPNDLPVGDAPVRGRQFRPDKDPDQAGDGIVGLSAADMDGDGHMELVVSSTFDGNVFVLMNRCH